jgi:HPt (histidine-containing phosphotransfer) domain-containing protein
VPKHIKSPFEATPVAASVRAPAMPPSAAVPAPELQTGQMAPLVFDKPEPATVVASPPEAFVETIETEPLISDTQINRMLDMPPGADAGTTSSRLPILDPDQVAAIRGLGKPLVFERLCDLLTSSSKDLFARFDAALAAGDLEQIAAAAHAIKSPVNNLGGRRLADLLERCETTALESGDLAAVRRTAAGLKAHYAALVAALEAETRRETGTR